MAAMKEMNKLVETQEHVVKDMLKSLTSTKKDPANRKTEEYFRPASPA